MNTSGRLTLADYDRMLETGVFDGSRSRLEFTRGEIREMTPIASAHEDMVDRLTRWSINATPKARIRVRVQNSIGLPELESVPRPDLAWVQQRDYSTSRPTTSHVLLIIEVALRTLQYDTGEKAELYASAGIADYWVVDIASNMIEVRRDPSQGRYRNLARYSGDDELHPLAVPEAMLHPASLWGSADDN